MTIIAKSIIGVLIVLAIIAALGVFAFQFLIFPYGDDEDIF